MTAPNRRRAPPETPGTSRSEQLRDEHVRHWLELRGFAGKFEHNAVDFLSHELGLDRSFVQEFIAGRQHLESRAALVMRRMIQGQTQSASFDYRAMTIAVYELAGEPVPGPPETPREVNVLSNGDTPENGGFDDTGRPIVVVKFADGHRSAVVLPKGAKVDGTPKVLLGLDGQMGSIIMVFVKEDQGATS